MEAVPGRSHHPATQGATVSAPSAKPRPAPDVGYTGSIMPPPEAVAGTYVGPDGRKIKVGP